MTLRIDHHFSRLWLFFGLIILTLADSSVAADPVVGTWEVKLTIRDLKTNKVNTNTIVPTFWTLKENGKVDIVRIHSDGDRSSDWGTWKRSGSTIIFPRHGSALALQLSPDGREMIGQEESMDGFRTWKLIRQGGAPADREGKANQPNRMAREEQERKAREQQERMARAEQERLAHEQQERERSEQEARAEEERKNGMSEERFLKQARELESGKRIAGTTERNLPAQQERARREQEAKEQDERVNGMSEERFLKQARELDSGARPAPAKAPVAKETRRFDTSVTGRTREEALAKLHREHDYRRKQDPTVTELTNIQVKSSVMKGPEKVALRNGKLEKVRGSTWERVDWYASGEYRMEVSKPQAASKQ